MQTTNCLKIKDIVGAKQNTPGAFYSPLEANLRALSTEPSVALGINFSLLPSVLKILTECIILHASHCLKDWKQKDEKL